MVVVGEGHVEGAEVVLQLGHGAGSDDRRGDGWVVQRPGQRHLGWCAAELGRDIMDRIGDRQSAFAEHPGRGGKVFAGLRAVRFVEVSAGVFAGQYAFGERCPRDHA